MYIHCIKISNYRNFHEFTMKFHDGLNVIVGANNAGKTGLLSAINLLYLDHDEDAFAELLEHKSNKDSMAERKAAESALAVATARSQELLRLYERVYEDNVNGKVTDDWFMRLSHKYEVEQEELKKQMFDLKNKIERLDTAQNSSGNFIRAIRKFMTMQTLTPIVLQELIDKIEVFPIEGTGKNRTQRLVIHYRFVGCIDLPSIVPKHTYKLDSRQGVAIEYLPSAV